MANGALQQVARIEDLCDTDVSRKWLRRECPDVLVNVQKRLRNRGAAREWVDVGCVEQS